MTHGPQYTQRAEAQEAVFLQQRIALAAKRLRDRRKISDRLKGIGSVALIGLCLYLGLILLSPWNLPTTLRHLAAGGGCEVAHVVKLTPAYRGQPGYWAYLDPGYTGIACAGSRPD